MPPDVSAAQSNAEKLRYGDGSDRHQKYYGASNPTIAGYAKVAARNETMCPTNPNTVGVNMPTMNQFSIPPIVIPMRNEKPIEPSRQTYPKLNVQLSDGGTEIDMTSHTPGSIGVAIRGSPVNFSQRQSQQVFPPQEDQQFNRETALASQREAAIAHIPQKLGGEEKVVVEKVVQNQNVKQTIDNKIDAETIDYSQRKEEQSSCSQYQHKKVVDTDKVTSEHTADSISSQSNNSIIKTSSEAEPEVRNEDKEPGQKRKDDGNSDKSKISGTSHKKKKKPLKSGPEEGSPFTCDTCEKQFSESKHLARHKLLHSKERQHKCSLCDMAFVRADHQRRHEKTHTGERPYGCPVCEKAFTRASHLKRHKRIHSGDRPYVCDQCEKSYIDPSHLARHKLSHFKKDM
ncbi:uncharacterized protein LOC144451199 [Glandiceps talaboti]